MGSSFQIPRWAVSEASRCLYCFDAPCIKACPAGINVPYFVRLIRWNDLEGAKEVIRDANYLGGICGYLCPSEELCEKQCTLSKEGSPVRIAALQSFACDMGRFVPEPKVKREKRRGKVAIIGAGPAGISCAVRLRSLGYDVEIFEKEKSLTGTVAREIPEFKIPKSVINRELKELDLKTIKIHLGRKVDLNLLENDIAKRYDAIFIAAGLDRPRAVSLQSKKLKGVYEAADFLSGVRKKAIRMAKGICVTIGGGDTALDCARTALRLGAEQSVVAYRRSEKEMPGSLSERMQSSEEGVEFLWRVSPVRLGGKERVRAVEFVRNRMVSSRKGGRKGFKEIPGTGFSFPADTVIFALGKERDLETSSFFAGKRMTLNPKTLQMGKSKFFAGGDWVNLGKTVVQAVADGKKAASSIDRYLSNPSPLL